MRDQLDRDMTARPTRELENSGQLIEITCIGKDVLKENIQQEQMKKASRNCKTIEMGISGDSFRVSHVPCGS